MDLSVIIPTHNRSDALAQTINNLSKQQFNGNWEAIIINNNSSDNTDEVVSDWQKKFPVSLILAKESKPGASAARNAGVRVAKGKYLVFIDNDILTEPDFLQRHYDALQQNPNSWIAGQVVNLPEQEASVFGKYRKILIPTISTSEKIREVDVIVGANSSLPRADFEKLGGFDENFKVASNEDGELAMRARKVLGIKILLIPSILVVHNDWAGWTFPDFCRRQEIYARSEFFYWQKYGDQYPKQRLVKENLPADWKQDSFHLLLRKKGKKLLGLQASQKILLESCNLLEKIDALHPLLYKLYNLALAGAINRGFNQGRKQILENKSN